METTKLPPKNWARLLFTTLLHLDQADEVELDYESSCVKRWYDRNKPFKICGSTTLGDIVSMQGNCSSNISSAENDAMGEIRARICLITNLKRFQSRRRAIWPLIHYAGGYSTRRYCSHFI
jgi:hypothetical protein